MEKKMGKTIRNQFFKHLTFAELLAAHRKCLSGKSCCRDAVAFDRNVSDEIVRLLRDLKGGRYHTGKYYEFRITEPKERVIRALRYRDRVVQQWYVEAFIKPFFIPRLIRQTYACVKGRGTHAAMTHLQRYIRRAGNCYVVKMDIAKFFYTIDKNILYNILIRKIRDRHVLRLTRMFIYGDEASKGIPIGNLPSQYFANIYLDGLDRFLQKLSPMYVRYMDDFVCLVPQKSQAAAVLCAAENYVETRLALKLNPKSGYFPVSSGVDFVGYRVFADFRLLRDRSKRTIRAIFKDFNATGDADRMLMRVASWVGHARFAGSSRYLTQSCLKGGVG
jgi:hypothetical protein